MVICKKKIEFVTDYDPNGEGIFWKKFQKKIESHYLKTKVSMFQRLISRSSGNPIEIELQ